MTAPMLSIKGLSKSFGALQVGDNIDIDVTEGELHALIGPNGAGKTTLINQLSGMLKSDAGTVVFRGEDITSLNMPGRVKKGLARSFQITSILPQFTVRENVAVAAQAGAGSSFRFFAPVAGERHLNEIADDLLTRVGLGSRISARAGSLSHGEKRLLEIAIALATKPRLLLLDEPLAGLGQQESEASIALLQRLKADLTIVLVEHDMDAVFALADRVSVLVNGRVLATGTPQEIQSNPGVRTAYLGDEEAA